MVKFYIWLTKGDNDFRSKEGTLFFNENKETTQMITDEEISDTNKFIDYLENEKQSLENTLEQAEQTQEELNAYMVTLSNYVSSFENYLSSPFATFEIEDGNLYVEVKEWQE